MTSETILRTFKGERWAKEVLEFRKRIKDAGVPNEALEKVEFVRSVRALGAGSAAARIQTMNQMMPILPALGGNGRQNFLDDYVAANSTYAQVERYFPRDEIGEQPSHDVWEAVQENAALKTGNATVVTETQDHLIHWQTHASEVAGLVQQVSQGAVPASAVAQPAVALAQHAAQHAQLVAQDTTRGEIGKQIVKAQKELEQQVSSLVQAAQSEQQQAQQQQAMMAQAQGIMSGQDPETQLKAAEAQSKMQLSTAKTQHQMGLRQAQADQKMQINAAMAAQKLNQQAQAANKPKGDSE